MYKYALFTIFLMISGTFSAQTAVSGGGDFISRYLWRGLDFGNIFSIQPSVALTSGDFEIGFGVHIHLQTLLVENMETTKILVHIY